VPGPRRPSQSHAPFPGRTHPDDLDAFTTRLSGSPPLDSPPPGPYGRGVLSVRSGGVMPSRREFLGLRTALDQVVE
jgi:hypothetical protein